MPTKFKSCCRIVKQKNIDIIEKQKVVEKLVYPVKLRDVPNPRHLIRNEIIRLKEKNSLLDKVINSEKTEDITEDSKFLKNENLLIIRLLENFLEKNN